MFNELGLMRATECRLRVEVGGRWVRFAPLLWLGRQLWTPRLRKMLHKLRFWVFPADVLQRVHSATSIINQLQGTIQQSVTGIVNGYPPARTSLPSHNGDSSHCTAAQVCCGKPLETQFLQITQSRLLAQRFKYGEQARQDGKKHSSCVTEYC